MADNEAPEVQEDLEITVFATIKYLIDGLPKPPKAEVDNPEFNEAFGKIIRNLAAIDLFTQGRLVKLLIAKTKYTQQFVKALIKEVPKELAKISDETESTSSQEEDKLDNTGGTFKVVNGFLTRHGGKLANFDARIVEEITTDDSISQVKMYMIARRLLDGTHSKSIEVPATKFKSMDWVAEHWSAKCWMEAKKEGQVAQGIRSLSEPVASIRFSHLGWRSLRGQKLYLSQGGAIAKDGWLDLDVRPGEGFEQYGIVQPTDDPEELQLAASTALEFLDVAPTYITAPVFMSVWLAPLISALGPAFVLWLYGHSGSCKSTLVALAMNFYGSGFAFNRLTASWVSTRNALEMLLWRGKDSLVPLDNLCPPSSGKAKVANDEKALSLIQAYADGASRGRLNRDSTEQAKHPPRCLPIATAEMLPPGNVSTMNRCVFVQFDEFDKSKLFAFDTDKERLRLLQVAFAGYIRHLAGIENTEIKDLLLRARKEVLVDYADVLLKTSHLRLAESLALIRVAQHLLYGYLRLALGDKYDPAIEEKIHEGLKGAVARHVETLGEDALDGLDSSSTKNFPAVVQFLECLRGMLQVGEVGLTSGAMGEFTQPEEKTVDRDDLNTQTIYRWIPKVGFAIDEEGEPEVWLLRSAALSAVKKKLGSEWLWKDSDLNSQLRASGLVKAESKKQLSSKRKTSLGPNTRVLVLSKSVVLGNEAAATVPTVEEPAKAPEPEEDFSDVLGQV